MQSLIQTTQQKPSDTLFLHVYKGTVNNDFRYYEDDGETFGYEKEGYFRRNISYRPAEGTLLLEKASGKLASKFKNIQLILHGFRGGENITTGGKPVNAEKGTVAFIKQVKRFDPPGESNPVVSCGVLKMVVPNSADEIKISFGQ